MIDRETILSTTNADERFFILHQQKTKKETAEAWSRYCKAEDDNVDAAELGRLHGEYIAATRLDDKAWAVLEEHLSLTQRRIILECGEITPTELHATTASMHGMWDREQIIETITPEEIEIIHAWELASEHHDECLGILNDLVNNCLNENPTEIGKAYQAAERAEKAESQAHNTMADHFTRIQRKMIYECQPIALEETDECETGLNAE